MYSNFFGDDDIHSFKNLQKIAIRDEQLVEGKVVGRIVTALLPAMYMSGEGHDLQAEIHLPSVWNTHAISQGSNYTPFPAVSPELPQLLYPFPIINSIQVLIPW